MVDEKRNIKGYKKIKRSVEISNGPVKRILI
jgi:hypothetical protein